MRLALGLDAAWTATEPSGVALVQETADGWRLRRSRVPTHVSASGRVAIRAFDGAAKAYGDQDSAIWVPDAEILR